MLGTFLGLETSLKGLQAQQAAIDTTAHNIDNANTPGYSRQRVNLEASPALDMPSLMSANAGQIGTGVQVQQITRLRSSYLDAQYRSQNSYSGYWNTQQDTLNKISAIINEPSDTGISTVMQNFFDAWSKLGSNPNDLSARTQVRQTGITLAQTLSQTATQLNGLKSDLQANLTDNITQANSLISRIGDLNKQISAVQAVGNQPNDLLDQRGVLLDQLSNLADIQTSDANGQFTLSVSGQTVLKGAQVVQSITADSPNPPPPTSAVVGGTSITKGVLGSIKDSLVQVNSYKSYLNNLAQTLATGQTQVKLGSDWSIAGNPPQYPGGGTFPSSTQYSTNSSGQTVATIPTGTTITVNGMNGLEQLGYSQDGQGQPFFTTSDGSSTINAENISVSPSASGIAAALNTTTDSSGNTVGMPGDGTLAMMASQLANSSFSFNSPASSGQTIQGTPNQFMQSLVGTLGVQSQTANQQVSNQQTLIQQIDNQRQSVSGVSIDQEMADMIKYQQAYNASARMVSTINSMLQTVVNLGQ